MIKPEDRYAELVREIKGQAPFTPDLTIVLGSGLGSFPKKVKIIHSIPTSSLPGYPPSTVVGHEGYIHFAEYGEKKLLIFQGRIHLYEGYQIYECILTSFLSKALGVPNMLITNAAGGVNPEILPGDIMLITSMSGIHIKMEMAKLMRIASHDQVNALRSFPSPELMKLFIQAGLEEKVRVRDGVYWYMKGPSYETPAEITYIRRCGADAVGMSTVHEAIYAAASGIKVCAVSCITNAAAGLSATKLSHDEVQETAQIVEERFERLVKRFITLLP